jgi:transcription-repair coupling factor (superfamily II helicase)
MDSTTAEGELDAVTASLSRANARVADAVRALCAPGRVDLTGLPRGGLAHVLALAEARSKRPIVLVTEDTETARRMAENLAFFAGAGEGARVLVYPAADTTPFLAVAPDRRAAMDRLSVLSQLARGVPFRFLVAPITGLLRRVPPRAYIEARSTIVRAEEELDRDAFLRTLDHCGYLRVPVAEDPGTFAVRGGLIDVFPPHATNPVRIELDDWLVMSIKRFDPDDQRTIEPVSELHVHPIRETPRGDAETALAREKVRALCDRLNVPTTQARRLVEDLESGRSFYGVEALLPAFFREIERLFDYLPGDARLVVHDPSACAKVAREERERARRDRGASVEDGKPAFELDELYLDEASLAAALDERGAAVAHRVAILGDVDAEDSALAALESTDAASLLHLGGDDQSLLVAELKARRATHGRDDGLLPVARRASAWLDAGMRVLFSARTQSQAERLVGLLRGYEVPVQREPSPCPPELGGDRKVRAQVIVGPLVDGFVLAAEGLAFVTEEEIFGTRAHRPQKSQRKKSGASRMRAALEDLRELEIGDYVVHADHGVGRYLGLERKAIGQSQLEKLRGDKPAMVEALIVEYAGGDRLFVPVTRLGLIQKFAAQDGHKPKLDRLGGSTFAKKKKAVDKAVRQMAEELLKLYAERGAAHREPIPPADRTYAEFEASFPFDETPDQAKAIEDVLEDLDGPQPMDRLVCGDVGFGKTEVALRAAFRVAMTGRQVAILCPTTVLAQQHYQNFRQRFADYPIEIRPLSRFVDAQEQTKTLAGLKEGAVDVVVGTHRLLSKDVHFKQLGLLVVDEEQRFGVTHKERIKKLRTHVDVLTLSATPIPRTLQLAIGGLRDLSLITTAPVDRRAVRTFACRWDDHTLKEAIVREMNRGGQVFFVYNRIEGLYERAQRLQELVPEARIVVAHGQMKETALERAMTDFVEGEYDILCSTAIIESGLDIPRANTMIIDRADIFGLSQLYQLRGRVGRSRERAYCYLVTPPAGQLTDEARARIEALERFTELGSGFHVASLDMELRGAGDLLGAEQSGNVSLVGFDMFVHMLEDAIAQLTGEPMIHDVDPELTLDVEHYLPDDYVDDVGLRLTFYKRFAQADDEDAIADLAAELEDRFGPLPPPAQQFVRAMRLRPWLRAYRILGCEATAERVTLHLREDTSLDPAKVMQLVGRPGSEWKLSPDMKLTRRFEAEPGYDSIDRAMELLHALAKLQRDDDAR